MKRIILILLCYLTITLTGSVNSTEKLNEDTMGNDWFHRPTTTYEKFLPLALEGDSEIQNFLGYMYFYGEGVHQNYKEAHYWFHLAAEQKNLKAQQNLAIFHSGTVINVPKEYKNLEEGNEWGRRHEENYRHLEGLGKIRINRESEQLYLDKSLMMSGKIDIGEKIYLTFCAGCHGFNGVASYPNAPSFMSGERLLKDDATLMDSIINGKGNMPEWGKTFDENLLAYTLFYIRARFSDGDVNIKLETDNDFNSVEGDAREIGERLFTTFCAGCHGFNGIAHYVNSPSFALGERLYKSDYELENSITNGMKAMPSWGDKLSSDQIRKILVFIRTLPTSFQNGIIGSLRSKPRIHFRFRPLGETGIEWLGADPVGMPIPDG
jgi:mono/diheme cytochrome c family protein